MKTRGEREEILNNLADLVHQMGPNDSLVTDVLRDTLLKEITGGFLPTETALAMFSDYADIRGRHLNIADGTESWEKYANAGDDEDTVLERAEKDADWHQNALLNIPEAYLGVAPVDYEGAQIALKEAVTWLGGNPLAAIVTLATAYGIAVAALDRQAVTELTGPMTDTQWVDVSALLAGPALQEFLLREHPGALRDFAARTRDRAAYRPAEAA